MSNTTGAAAVFNKCAQQYQDKFMDVSLYSAMLDRFCHYRPKPGAAILEIGCGPGNITKYLLHQRPDFSISGIDLAPNMIDLARTNNESATFQVMDCRDVHTLRDIYDGIICGFCLPYLSPEETVKLLNDASSLLAPGGILYLSTMEENDENKSGVRTSSSGDQLYIHFHSFDFLAGALKDTGFSILDENHQAFPSDDGPKITDLIIIAQKIVGQ